MSAVADTGPTRPAHSTTTTNEPDLDAAVNSATSDAAAAAAAPAVAAETNKTPLVTATPEPASTAPAAPVVADPKALPAVQAAKDGAANESVDGTGVSTEAVANDLGVPTKSREEHEREKELEHTTAPARSQDHETGGMVKQYDTADDEAIDPDTFNVWSNPHEVPKEVGE